MTSFSCCLFIPSLPVCGLNSVTSQVPWSRYSERMLDQGHLPVPTLASVMGGTVGALGFSLLPKLSACVAVWSEDQNCPWPDQGLIQAPARAPQGAMSSWKPPSAEVADAACLPLLSSVAISDLIFWGSHFPRKLQWGADTSAPSFLAASWAPPSSLTCTPYKHRKFLALYPPPPPTPASPLSPLTIIRKAGYKDKNYEQSYRTSQKAIGLRIIIPFGPFPSGRCDSIFWLSRLFWKMTCAN